MSRVGRSKPPAPMVEKTARGLVPASAHDAEVIDSASIGALFDLVPRSRRSNPQNRLYWGVLEKVVSATGAWPTSAHLHEQLVKGCGFTELVLNPFTGLYEEERDSTAFDAMPPADFKVFMDTALAKLSEAIGVDVMDLLPPRETP